MTANKSSATPSRWAVAATVLFYMCAAIAMVMVNKWVLNSTKTPLFFLLAQLLIAVVLFIAAHLLGLFKITLKLDFHTCKGLIPMVSINVIGLSSNNYCLKYVDASFYQIARGLVLPLTVLFTVLFLRQSRPSTKIFLACGIVTLGFFVGIALDGNHSSTDKSSSPFGIIFGLVSSMTTALHAVVIKRSLDVVGGDAIELAWYSNVMSATLLIPLMVVVGEVPDILDIFYASIGQATVSDVPSLSTFVWGSTITGIVGWLLSIAGVLSIKITSPITHMVSSACRGILQSFMGVWFFNDIITVGRGSSITIILAGSTYYTWVKNEELLAKRAREAGGVTEPADVEQGRNGYVRVPMEEIRTSLEQKASELQNHRSEGRA